MSQSEFTQVSRIQLVAGNVGLPGAPILNLVLLYNIEPNPSTLSGMGVVALEGAPANEKIIVHSVSGVVHGLALGKATRVFTLKGEYWQAQGAPAIGSYREQFTATFVTDSHWHGEGAFSYGTNYVKGIAIKPLD